MFLKKTANKLSIQHKKWFYWNLWNYLPEKCNKKNHNKKSAQFLRIAILKNFAKSTRKHLCWNPFFIEFSGLQFYLTRDSSTDVFNNAFSLKHLRPMPKFHGPTPPTPKFLPTPFFWPTPKFYRPTQPLWSTQIFGPRHSRTHVPRTHASPCNPHDLADSLTILTSNNLCFTEFSANIHWNTRLAASDVFHMFTQSIKFF